MTQDQPAGTAAWQRDLAEQVTEAAKRGEAVIVNQPHQHVSAAREPYSESELEAGKDAYDEWHGNWKPEPCPKHTQCIADAGHKGPCSVPAWSEVWSRD